MNKSSFIYSNIRFYRFVMSLLYKGRYFGRYGAIVPHIAGKKVTELCFGDTVIAEHCRKNGIDWKGLDIHDVFVKNAIKKGFAAEKTDLRKPTLLPEADTLIIAGSLYHFHDVLERLITDMLDASPLIIISEPVRNLSDNTGIIGKLAKASATVDGKAQHFRYTDKTLREELEKLGKKLNFKLEIGKRFSKDRIILLRK